MTDEQQIICDCRDKIQIVNASAGSGKTTVMIKKIYNLLTQQNVDIGNIVVVTFTVLASLEMKQKLINNIMETLQTTTDLTTKERLNAILEKINTAAINTIDGFCSALVKKYFYKLNISPNINIISNITSDYYKSLAFLNAIEEFSKNYKSFVDLTDIFQSKARNYNALKDCVLKLYNFLSVMPNQDQFLQNSYKDYPLSVADMKAGQIFMRNVIYSIYHYQSKIKDYGSWYTNFAKTNQRTNQILNLTDSLDVEKSPEYNYEILYKLSQINFKFYDKFEGQDKDIYQQFKAIQKKITDIADSVVNLGTVDEIGQNSLNCYENIKIFIDFYNTFEKKYEKLKKQNDFLDFVDVEKLTLKLLKNKQILSEIHSNFTHIFVDEFQDVNALQNQIITQLAGKNNLFIVGDLKQSIYGFRQSDPKILLNKIDKADLNKKYGTNLRMVNNYRSNPNILNFVNKTFSKIMTKQSGDIEYKSKNEFYPYRKDYPLTDSDVQLFLIKQNKTVKSAAQQLPVYAVKNNLLPKEPKQDKKQMQAEIVARQILAVAGKDFYDGNTNTYRTLQFCDICILSRSVKPDLINSLLKVFAKYDIPINYDLGYEIEKSEGIRFILGILKVIANVAQDYEYITFFTSVLSNLTMNELGIIRLTDKTVGIFECLQNYAQNFDNQISHKIKQGIINLQNLQLCSLTQPVKQIIYTLLNKYKLENDLKKYQSGQVEFDSVIQFVNTLSEAENNLSLTEFLLTIENKQTNHDKAAIINDSNAVLLQNIHASKGLEYPVVFLINAGSDFVYLTEHNIANFDHEVGIGLNCYNLIDRTEKETIQKQAIKLLYEQNCYKEEMRLLYVALTRAKNKLIIVGNFDKTDFNVENPKNYLNLILSAYTKELQESNCQNFITNSTKFEFIDASDSITKLPLTAKAKLQKPDKKQIDLINSFSYKNKDLTTISIKNNVTALTRVLNEEHNILPNRLHISDNLNLEKSEVIELGTKYHNVLEKMDFVSLPTESYGGLDSSLIKLAHYTIGQIVSGAKLYKEAKFMMYLPYGEIFKESKIADKVLVQGIIDLVAEFEDGIVLIDYKYSALNNFKLIEKYKSQLMLYALACGKKFKKPIKNTYIYNIQNGELILI